MSRNATKVSDFRHQMARVRQLFHPISEQDILKCVQEGVPLPPRSVLITFDDGYRNNLTRAIPELERAGVPALFFLTTGHINQNRLLWTHELDERIGSWQPRRLPLPQGAADVPTPASADERQELAKRIRNECKRLSNTQQLDYLERLREQPLRIDEDRLEELYRFLTWNDVREMNRRGFAIGSHSVNHLIQSSLNSDQLSVELRESKSHIERELSQPCRSIAYPNGGARDVSKAVLEAVAEADYQLGFMLQESLNPRVPRRLEIDRVWISGTVSADGFDALLHGLQSWIG
jgi:peptidoglycan/xylan/chitin deacetylase (PgdA/CDA1 family)